MLKIVNALSLLALSIHEKTETYTYAYEYVILPHTFYTFVHTNT